MGIFALLSFLSSLIILFLGIYVYTYKPKHPLNRVFLLLCLIEAYIAFTEFQVRQSYNFETAYLWLRIGAFWPLIVPVIIHFLLIFMEKSKLLKSKLTYFLLYFPPLVFSLLFATNIVKLQPVKEYWGWTYTLPEKSLLLDLIVIGLILLYIYSFLLCFRYYVRSTDYKKKKQIVFVFVGISIPFIVCIITEYFFHLFQIKFPELTSVSVILECGLVGYAISKYELFKLTPLDAMEDIISVMSDSLILVNSDKRISAANQTALKLLGYKEDEIIGQPVANLLEEQNENALLHENLKNTGIITDKETTLRSKDGRHISISLSTSLITDNKGRFRGIIYAGRDITERKRTEEELSRYRKHLEE